jgi:hypothetical protein
MSEVSQNVLEQMICFALSGNEKINISHCNDLRSYVLKSSVLVQRVLGLNEEAQRLFFASCSSFFGTPTKAGTTTLFKFLKACSTPGY